MLSKKEKIKITQSGLLFDLFHVLLPLISCHIILFHTNLINKFVDPRSDSIHGGEHDFQHRELNKIIRSTTSLHT